MSTLLDATHSFRARRSLMLACGLLAAALFPLSGMAQGTTSSEPPAGAPTEAGPVTDHAGCVLDRHSYMCNFEAFRHVFHRSRTIAVEASPRDRTAHSQLEELVTQINRTVAPAGAADLVFSVLPIDNGGVMVGPSDMDLATLRIYRGSPDGSHGELVWAETYRGQADRPWPATVHALLQQFQDRLKKRYR